MINIELTNMAHFINLPETHFITLKNYFTISNPLFTRKIELGKAIWGIPASLKYYEDLSQNKNLFSIKIPIGGLNDALNLLIKSGVPESNINIIDNRISVSDSNFFNNLKFTGSLRDYQNDTINSMLPCTVGIVEALTGSGKTITFIKFIIEKQINTLILVNTIELLNQTINSFVKFSNLQKDDIGIIGNGKYIIKPITVALHQTMMKLDKSLIDDINNKFGMIIADEVHVVAANLYYKTLSKLKAKFKFGFSATPARNDGLTKVLFWAVGQHIHKVPMEALKGSIILPSVVKVFTSYYFPLFDSSDYTYMISDLSDNKPRNQQIIDYIKTNYSDPKYNVCILCNQLSQVDHLCNNLGPDAAKLTSKMPKKERLKIIDGLNKSSIRYIVSTYSLFATGIDVPQLNVLILAAPRKSPTLLKQAAGRIMRPAPNKNEAIIVDFIDEKVELLRNQSKSRHLILKGINNEYYKK